MNHQALIERSHKQAVDKGFWETPLTFDMAMALIISEIAEALEAYRKGRVNPDWNDQDAVKNSEEVEFSDVVIRIYDWCGRHNYELEEYDHSPYWSDDEGYNYMQMFKRASETYNSEYSLEKLFNLVLSYCRFKNISIEEYVMWKLDYNLSRPFKHGKQF